MFTNLPNKLGSNQHKTKRSFINEKAKKDIILLVLAGYAGASMIMYTTQFIQSHNFRSPLDVHFEFSVKPQMPFTPKVISPIPNKKVSFIEKVYAEEAGASAVLKVEDVDVFDRTSVREYVRQRTIEYFGYEHWDAMDALMTGESNYQTYVMNHEGSGACGIFQALPCQKLGNKGLDLENQVTWGLEYIKNRYKNPTLAYQFWLSKSPRWY